MPEPGTWSRRAFIRAKPNGAPPLRPPWAKSEQEFLSLCSRCDACAMVCPTRLIVRGDGGFPVVDFSRAECTFCHACVESCGQQAFQGAEQPPWRLSPLIREACLAKSNVVCRSCGDVCEHAAILFRPHMGRAAQPEIRLDMCTGCGACIGACPVRALEMTNSIAEGMQ